MVNRFLMGLDLGQSQDYTAVAVAERMDSTPVTHYYLRHLERFRLGTPYPAVVERMGGLLSASPLKGNCRLVVDATGVGAPVVDLLRQAGLKPVGVSITGGDRVTSGNGVLHVPKRDLVGTLQVMFQSGRLKVAEGLAEAELLVQELLNFRVRITATAHDTYGAWREGDHDDLVLAVALACWYGEWRGKRGQVRASVVDSGGYGRSGEGVSWADPFPFSN